MIDLVTLEQLARESGDWRPAYRAACDEIERLQALLAEAREWLGDNDHEESLIRRINTALREVGV